MNKTGFRGSAVLVRSTVRFLLSRGALPRLIERLRGAPLRLAERTPRSSTRHAHSNATCRMDGRCRSTSGHSADLDREVLFSRSRVLIVRARRINSAGRGPHQYRQRCGQPQHAQRSLKCSPTCSAARSARSLRSSRPFDLPISRSRIDAASPALRYPCDSSIMMFFVAEHDDHHLASITELAARARERIGPAE